MSRSIGAQVDVEGAVFCRLHTNDAQDLWAMSAPRGRGTGGERCAEGFRTLNTPDPSVPEEVRGFREYTRFLRKKHAASMRPGAVAVSGSRSRATARVRGFPGPYELKRIDGRWLLTEGPETGSLQ